MADELQVKKEHTDLTPPSEETRPGPVFAPAVDIFESDKAITVLADMPGVGVDDLRIGVEDDVLTLTGDVPELKSDKRERLSTEYGTGRYKRQFTLSHKIDQAKIEAKLTHGVLRLTLPKIDAAQPRKIIVKAG